MSENQTKAQQVTSKVGQVIAAVGARLEAGVGELHDLQSKGLAQAKTFVESATRATHEQVAFAEQMGGECRKLVLAATRRATELFTPKA
jgi:hypothetical protein